MKERKQYLKRVVQDLAPVAERSIRRRIRIGSREQDAVTTLLSSTPICVLGNPGSGKTTTLQMAAFEAAQEGRALVPFFLRAALLEEGATRDIVSSLSSYSISQPSANLVRQALTEKKALVFIDGLDEIDRDHREPISTLIRGWIVEHPELHWVLSTRPIGRPDLPDFITMVHLLDLSLDEVDNASSLFFDDRGHAENFKLAIASHDRLASLASNPLLLGLLARIFQYKGVIPTRKADLYASWTDIALRQWDKERGISRSEEFLKLEETRHALAVLALNLIEERRVIFNLPDWFLALRSVGILNAEHSRSAELTFEENILGSGLVRRFGSAEFTFSHATLQEYFASLALLRMETDFALEKLGRLPAEGVAAFYAEATPDPVRTARRFVVQERFDDVRRLFDAFPHLDQVERERIIALIAKRLGVEQVFFRPTKNESQRKPLLDTKEHLRHLWQNCQGDLISNEKGKAFEEFCAALFASVFRIVETRRLAKFGEIDLICEVKAESFWIRWPGDCFVECKNLGSRVPISVVNEFVGKCSTVQVRLAFLLSVGALTRPARERISRSWSQADVPDMAWIDGSDIRGWLENESDAEAFLKSAVRRASYG